MIAFPAGVRVWIDGGVTDMRHGMNTLALMVQQGLGRDPHAGEIFCFRGRKGDLVKLLWHDGEACRSTSSGWRPGSSSGQPVGAAMRCRSLRLSSDTVSKRPLGSAVSPSVRGLCAVWSCLLTTSCRDAECAEHWTSKALRRPDFFWSGFSLIKVVGPVEGTLGSSRAR